MKIINKKLIKNHEGTLTLLPQGEEDMWHIYNLLMVGDSIQSTTYRKVQTVVILVVLLVLK